MSPFWKPSAAPASRWRHRAPRRLGGGIEPQLLGERGRQIGDLGAQERRARADHELLARRFPARSERDRDRISLPPRSDAELGLAAERLGGEAVVERIRIVDRLAVDADDQVAGLEAGARRRAPVRDARDQRAGRPLEPELSAISAVTACSSAPSQGRLHRAAAALGGGDHHRAPCWREWQSRCLASRPSARRSRC